MYIYIYKYIYIYIYIYVYVNRLLQEEAFGGGPADANAQSPPPRKNP